MHMNGTSFGSNIPTKPRIEFIESHPPRFVETNQEGIGTDVIKLKPVSVHCQKCSGDRDGDALVAIKERMVLRQTLPECCFGE